MKTFKSLQVSLLIILSIFVLNRQLLSLQIKIENDKDQELNIQDQQFIQHHQYSDTKCTADRVRAAYKAMAQCNSHFLGVTVSCIEQSISLSIKQVWGIYVVQAAKVNSSGVSYWVYEDCNIIQNNYGPNNRTFKLWKAIAGHHSSQQSKREIQTHEESEQKLPGNSCTEKQKNAVDKAIVQCFNIDNDKQANCLREYLYSNLNQKWGAMVTELWGQYDYIQFALFDNCMIKEEIDSRTGKGYMIWKAE